MTTDITELAQSLKAAAENAIGAHERLAAYPYGEIIDISQHEGEQIDIDITDLNEFNKEANPVNILALVEALEKAQQRISQLESRTVKLPKPKNSDQGWKIDPEFINKVQDAIGYDDTCECWEGTPSMELVEAVLLAAAGIKVEDE
ncbi:ead/Ea22-like family protein [Klebsiella quasipneumoniae]|uniref:ead/Ea22-like family protein n=1 Tax=Klebsiella quasipneumoniae TaxID=1463165 RepID=UPI001CA3C9E2|nr:ead/Ea22-like family protein [Klebsiella quasipneumoniae]MBY8385075.1 ead/Ea22-like family protein [Klebsiella quasipneumoniae]